MSNNDPDFFWTKDYNREGDIEEIKKEAKNGSIRWTYTNTNGRKIDFEKNTEMDYVSVDYDPGMSGFFLDMGEDLWKINKERANKMKDEEYFLVIRHNNGIYFYHRPKNDNKKK